MVMSNTEKKVKDIRHDTRRKFSTEEKIRIVLEGLVISAVNSKPGSKYRTWSTPGAHGITRRPRARSNGNESLDNVPPADVYVGRRNEILDQRAIVKQRPLSRRKVHDLQLGG